jgi:hypothetical protein
MSDNSELPQNELPPEPSQIEEIKTENAFDFWLGFFGALVANVFLFILIGQILSDKIPLEQMYIIQMVFPLIINIGAIIYFSVKKRKKIVGGILVIASIGFIFSLCLSSGCFSDL